MANLYIIKLGGSVITAKEENRFEVQEAALERLGREIKEGIGNKRLILVHGAGPFGHTNVVQFDLNNGVYTAKQQEGLEKTIKDCNYLNSKVVEKLEKAGIPAIGFDANKLVTQENKKIIRFDLAPIEKALKEGKTPVLYGQMVLDTKLNASVVSGDTLLAFLAKKFRPKKIFLGTDVNGIFTADPKTNPQAKPIPVIDKKNFQSILSTVEEAKTVDVTGGMKGKLASLKKIGHRIPMVVLDANIPNNLLAALQEKKTGTLIRL